MRIFEQLESEVRSYVRSFPVIFETAEGSYLYDEQGNVLKDGVLKRYYENGKLREEILYKDGKDISTTEYDEKGEVINKE